ncbi:hypothetical protein [Jiangella alba]|uniref:DUF600 family protein n=1 Tax=Jiangella alba TaxID=561176 RepID=A0A1H5MY52_9ACTN|nr:hypothetical protein [Jiangella alba]SEE94206.1 hypothetical protein SAMN04488561_3531 [Jiangella alba]
MSIPDQPLEKAVGEAMIAADEVPGGWNTLTLDVTAAGDLIESSFEATMPDGSTEDLEPPDDANHAARALRKAMYTPGEGTWWNATFTVDAANRSVVRAVYDYDTPPLGGMVDDDDPNAGGDADEALMLKDHRQFPRDEAHLPAWHPARAGTSA